MEKTRTGVNLGCAMKTALAFAVLLMACGCVGANNYSRVNDTNDFANGKVTWGELPKEPEWTSRNASWNSALSGLYSMANGLIDLYQKSEFPYEMLRSIARGQFDPSNRKGEILNYDLGIILACVVGLIFVLSIVGILIAIIMCRRKARCGGQTYQTFHRTNEKFKLAYLILNSLSLAVIFSMSVISMDTAAKSMSGMQTMKQTTAKSLTDFKDYWENLASQLNYVSEESFGHLNDVIIEADLVGIDQLLGKPVRETWRTEVDAVFADLYSLDPELQDVMTRFKKYYEKLEYIKANEGIKLKTILAQAHFNVTNTINDASCYGCNGSCAGCKNIVPGDIAIGCDYWALTNITSQYNTMVSKSPDSMSTGLGLTAKQIYENIPTRLKTRFLTITDGIRNKSAEFRDVVKPMTDDIEDNIRNAFNYSTMTQGWEDVYPQLKQASEGLFAMIFLGSLGILGFMGITIAGMVIGFKSNRPPPPPTERSQMSQKAAKILMIAVYVGFGSSIVYITMAASCVFFGANYEKVTCEPMDDDMAFLKKFMDEPNSVPGYEGYFLASALLKNGTTELTTYDVLTACRDRNAAAYDLMKLHNVTNLEDKIDYKQHIPNFGTLFDPMYSNLTDVVFYTSALQTWLADFKTAANLNWTEIHEQLNKNVSGFDLQAYWTNLDLIAGTPYASGGPVNPAKTRLAEHSTALKSINSNQIPALQPHHQTLGTYAQDLEKAVNATTAHINSVISKLQTAQARMHSESSNAITKAVNDYRTRIISYYTQYETKCKSWLQNTVGACRPLFELVMGPYTQHCDVTVDNLNGCWVALGWTSVFVFVSIFLNMKMYPFFKIMLEDDPTTAFLTPSFGTGGGMFGGSSNTGLESLTTLKLKPRKKPGKPEVDQVYDIRI